MSTDSTKSTKKYYCYILRNLHPPDINRTYNGKTNDLVRRLGEHNQLKSKTKGAVYTRKWGNHTWQYIAIISGFTSEKEALRCEWRIKKPEGKNRSSKYNSPSGRIRGLDYILDLEKFTSNCEQKIKDQHLTIWILKEYRYLLRDRLDYVHLKIVELDDFNEIELDKMQ